MKKLPNLHMFRDRNGVFRCYVRRSGAKQIPIFGKIGSPQFMAAYRKALRSPKVAPRKREPKATYFSGPCVYFIRGGDFIKIGRTNDVRARLIELQVGHPQPLELLAIAMNNGKLEQALHSKFRLLRAQGEWFRAEPELLAYIEDVRMKIEQAAANLQLKIGYP